LVIFREEKEMEKKLRPVLVAALVFFFVLVGIQSAVWASPGAIWTTDVSGTVNKNIYDNKCDVYLLGGPQKIGAAGLPDGDYYVQVTNPNGSVVLGRSWNNGSSIVRVVRVVNGEFNELLENGVYWGDPPAHLCTFLFSGPGFTSAGYADTPNMGGEYKVWASLDPNFAGAKTDNFKVRPGPPPQERVTKWFKLTVPAILLDPAYNALFGDAVFSALYTFDDPEGVDPPVWLDPILNREDDTLVFSGQEDQFQSGDIIWWKFIVTSTGYSCESPIYGPETLTAPGPYTNYAVLKAFELSVPAMLVEYNEFADLEFGGWYSLTDPVTDGNWVGVPLINLTKEDDTYLFFGLALFKANDTIWWKFTASDTYYSWESSVGGSETLAWPGPQDGYVNAEIIPEVLKTWRLLAGFNIPDAEYFASWSVDQTTWHDVPLVEDPAGVWTATTEFPVGMEVYYKFRGEWDTIVFWQSGLLGPETLDEPITNEVEIPTLTKTWILHVYPNGSGATYFAAWGFDNTTPFDVPLTQVSPGVWTADTVLPVGITIYFKFYGKINGSVFWQSSVFGPETLTENKTNEFWYSMPRTIGYWKNWGNHFPASTMAIIVAEVNSDANGFSTVFRAGTSNVAGDTGYYQLTVGTSGPKGATPGVAGWLQEHKADLMYQMLRAQLLGLELSVAIYQVRASIPPATNEGMIVGVSPDAIVYLSKASGFSGYSDPAVNPWFGQTTRTVLQIIQTVEAAAASNWSGWSRAKQGFAKNIIEAINQAGEGGIRILEP
jgi:hypothetical protein